MPKITDEVKKNTIYIVKDSKVKEFAKIGEMRVASDFCEALNLEVGKLIIKACVKAREDSRATIRPGDLVGLLVS